MERMEFSALLGKTLTAVDRREIFAGDSVIFETKDGETYGLFHEGECCESVTIDDICGDLADLIGAPLLLAEEVVSDNVNPEGVPEQEEQDSFTWTFYKLATVKGAVTIRWYGESSGYYSESVSFAKCEPE